MSTAIVHHEDMTAARLLWDDPECEIECPERLCAALSGLQRAGLEGRCLRVSAREASEEELSLVHSAEYVALVRATQGLTEGELKVLSGKFDAVYFHPETFHCARLAAGAALQLVDAVLTGTARNGLALVRPPGHHSQRAAANGFCVFNNVALAAQHARQRHGLDRILIVDWDIHHGQGIQYTFEDDPGVLYFSWHRYEHGRFWPCLRESDADVVGRGPGSGFTVNLPWNQVGMGNADYMAAFLHVLLPLAFEFDPELVLVSAGFDSAVGDPEGEMLATPECFAHLTRLLQVLAGGRVCAVLEGGYHLDSLAHSVCMTVRALLGDPIPPLSGPMVPCHSALESIQRVRAAQAPHWMSLQSEGVDVQASAGLPRYACDPYSPPEARPSAPPPGSPVCEPAAATPSPLLDELQPCPPPPIRTAVALTVPDAALFLPPGVLHQVGSVPREETEAWARPHESLAQDEACTVLGKLLHLLDGILDGQVNNGLTLIPGPAVAAALDVVIQRALSHGSQRLLCLALGQLDRPLELADDGRTLWLSIKDQAAAAPSPFHVCVPLPGTTGGFLSCLLGLVLPLAYSCRPDLVLLALGPGHGLQEPRAALLAAALQGPAGGRVLALVEEVRPAVGGEAGGRRAGPCPPPPLPTALALALHGAALPSLGAFCRASPEESRALTHLRRQLEPRWEMLRVSGGPRPLSKAR
ncbi:polyamine deacetylase HDAC10 isoform X1 [Ochotona curzoniae]|uniref:polyamine deacetylase HDAC10 isoform X1 n=1 Tax=Ochotona curzoniae TaxID=130825 RepID=UPI001B350981|nr:polyamine deacetylase HDAC10 isoform X1 [Ochotona curzoniae]